MSSTHQSWQRTGLALLAALAAISDPASQGAEPTEAQTAYLKFVEKQADALRAGDAPPTSLDKWRDRKIQIRGELLRAWGGFPRTAAPLTPKVLGTLDRDGYRVEKLIFQTRPGVWMTANAYVPKASGKHPAILAVHGHWKGAKQDPVVQARCIGAVKLGFFVLAVDAFGAGERAVGKALGEYHGEMTAATLLPVGLPLSGLQVYENLRAVDYLRSRPEVDGEHIGVTGASGGGNQSMYAGAWDERLEASVPVCSVGNYRAYLGIACCMCELVPGALRFTEEWGVLGLTAPRGLMIINADQDAPQFSVAAAKRTLGPLEAVYRLHDQADRLRHAVFESKHDYNQAMREAMYGWMTLNLKHEGDGQPIAEPAHTPEDPETLCCYPGESRPDDWVTLPRFAAAEGRKLLAAKALPNAPGPWQVEAKARRQALVETVFGGFPTVPPTPTLIETQAVGSRIVFESEPGLKLTAKLRPGSQRISPLVVVIDLDAGGAATPEGLPDAIERAGWGHVTVSLRATRENAWPNDRVGKAPDHNSAEWGLWIGRPLLGQWVFDVRRLLDVLEKMDGGLPADVYVIGNGAGGLVALSAAALDPRITRAAAVGTLASYITERPYDGQRLGVMAPGILREVGDVAHLAALAAPKRVVVAGGVTGDGKGLTPEQLRDKYQPAAHVWNLLGVAGEFRLLDAIEPARVIEALR